MPFGGAEGLFKDFSSCFAYASLLVAVNGGGVSFNGCFIVIAKLLLAPETLED